MTDADLEKTLAKRMHEDAGLSPSAISWLVSVFRSAQTLDDYADGGEVSRQQLDRLIWDCLAGCHLNPFFQRHSAQLLPVLACAVLQWKASDTMEREGRADARSFVWRASFYQLVLMAMMLEHGPATAMENADVALRMYGENFEEYQKEFSHA
jgi:hypothetical protein